MSDAISVVREVMESIRIADGDLMAVNPECASALARVLAVAEAAVAEKAAHDALYDEMGEASGARIEGLSQSQEDAMKRLHAAVAALTTEPTDE